MRWYIDAIKNYDKLKEAEKAHVDAALDNNDNDPDMCICGVKNCEDGYDHMTHGY